MTPEEIAELWVRGDPALESAEKETTIRWAKPDEEAVIHTDERGPGRRLIQHPDSTVEEVSVLRGDGDTYATLEPERVEGDDEVVSVRVRLPVAAVSIKSEPRGGDQHAEVVSDAVIRADGGRYVLPSPDTVVEDRDKDDRLVVLEAHPTTSATDRTIGRERTVADVNPEYDPHAPVISCVYVEEIVERVDEWRDAEDLKKAVDEGELSKYDFPADRLAVVEEVAQ